MYHKDGKYSIDNNLVERQVRPFTALRKAIQYYGSDAGAEMAAVYLSVVSTVKLAGQSVWRFLGDVFEDMVTGVKKHLSLLSLSTTQKNLTKKYGKLLKIGLATGQAYAICLIYKIVQKLTTNYL